MTERQHESPLPSLERRNVAVVALLALFFATLTAFNLAVPAQPAQAAPFCTPGSIYVDTGGGVNRLDVYSTTGALKSSVPTARAYTDIAFSADGLTMYGIVPGVQPVLYTLDETTGAETGSIVVTGLPAADYYVNALSALPDGSLLVGASRNGGVPSQQIFRINPTTGASTLFPAAFPSGYASAGDFLSMADGDILAVGDGFSGNALFRIAPDYTMTRVGTVPISFGAAQSGGKIYLAGSSGDLYEIDTVPTAASSAAIPTTTIASTGLPFFGATAQQDSGLCSELTVAKSADPVSGTPVVPGETITYTITLSNANGSAPAEVDLTDSLDDVLDDTTIVSQPAVVSGAALTVGPIANDSFRIQGVLPVGEQSTISYSVTVDDPPTGDRHLANFVIPTGTTPPTTCEESNTACTDHPMSVISLAKSVDPADSDMYVAGQEVTYSFVVTNQGQTTLTNVTVDDNTFDGAGTLGPITPVSVATLAPGASATFTAAYTLTQEDIDNGTVTNTATATGTPPVGPPIVSPPSTVELPSIPDPAVSLVKSVTPDTVSAAGQDVTYSFLVTNTGNRTLTDIAVEEGAFDGTGTLGPITPTSAASLLPGESATFTATYTVTQADIDRGSTSNSAIATAVPPTGPPIESAPSTAVLPSVPAPGVALVKSVDPTDRDLYQTGQEVTYSFLVTNTGTATLTNVTVNEETFDGTGTLGPLTPSSVATLAPAESATFTATYTLTQVDVDRGSTANTATVTANPPTGPPIESLPSSVVLPSIPVPEMSLVKSVDATTAEEVGQEVTYSFLVTNTGTSTLTNVSVDEETFDGTGTLSPIAPAVVATLTPGQSATFTASYTLTQADIDRGSTTNTATATATPPNEPPIQSPPSTVELPSDPEAPPAPEPTTPETTTPPSGGGLSATGSEPLWGAMLAASLLIVVGGALKVKFGSRLSRR